MCCVVETAMKVLACDRRVKAWPMRELPTHFQLLCRRGSDQQEVGAALRVSSQRLLHLLQSRKGRYTHCPRPAVHTVATTILRDSPSNLPTTARQAPLQWSAGPSRSRLQLTQHAESADIRISDSSAGTSATVGTFTTRSKPSSPTTSRTSPLPSLPAMSPSLPCVSSTSWRP